MSGDRRLQAFVEHRAEDAEATSALEVARTRLAAGRRLRRVRRLRLFELTGALPGRHEAEDLLHRSTRFYNPAKERCTVRDSAEAPGPFRDEEALLLVVDRGLERRLPAERWWQHETGERIEVREGVVWALTFEPGTEHAREANALAAVTDRGHGLFSNPHFQDSSAGEGAHPPWPWIEGAKRAAGRRRA